MWLTHAIAVNPDGTVVFADGSVMRLVKNAHNQLGVVAEEVLEQTAQRSVNPLADYDQASSSVAGQPRPPTLRELGIDQA